MLALPDGRFSLRQSLALAVRGSELFLQLLLALRELGGERVLARAQRVLSTVELGRDAHLCFACAALLGSGLGQRVRARLEPSGRERADALTELLQLSRVRRGSGVRLRPVLRQDGLSALCFTAHCPKALQLLGRALTFLLQGATARRDVFRCPRELVLAAPDMRLPLRDRLSCALRL